MKDLLLRLWSTAWDEIDNRTPKLRAIGQAWLDEIREKFLSGWIRPAPAPYYIWFGERLAKLVSDFFDWVEELLGVLPALIVSHVILSEIKIDKKLRQRVMTLDQVALFPARVIIDIGIREIVTGGAPRSFQVQQRGKKLEDVFVLAKTGRLSKLKSFLFGSLWSRIVRLFFLFSKWAKTFAYVFLLYRYVEMLEDRNQWSLLFNATLSNEVPRRWERSRIYRRAPGGVKSREPALNPDRKEKSNGKRTQRV